jgi:DNA-binding PadR family transcriptional regulator
MAAYKKTREAQIDGKSPVKAAVLAVLLDAPGHGYDVARRLNRRMGSSWTVRPKHIYSTIKQLEQDGLVCAKEQHLDKPPYRRTVFHPTAHAEQARREWLAERPASSFVRSDIHARIAFSSEQDIPELLRSLAERREDILEEIEENAATETARVCWLGVSMSLYRSAVDKRLKAEMEWIGEACRELEAHLAEQRSQSR